MQNEHVEDKQERIEISVSCRNLKWQEPFFRPLHQVTMYLKKSLHGIWTEYGATESVPESTDHDFVKTFEVDYVFEFQQYVKFQLMLKVQNGQPVRLGSVETSIGAIVGAKSQILVLDLKNNHGESSGEICFKYEKKHTTNESAFMKLRCKKVDNKRYFPFKSSPYLKISKYFLARNFH